MVRSFSDKRIRYIVMMCLVALIFVLFNPYTVRAKDDEIKSMNDFYDKLSAQIMEHNNDASYEVSGAVKDRIMSMEFSDYMAHYNEDSPLTSGCYLSYYLDSIQLYYSHGKLRVLIVYSYTKTEMDEHFAKMNELAESLKCNEDYETIQAVHDYLVEHFKYDDRTMFKNHTDIEGFRDGEMVCSGYSLAAYYLLNSAGIKTRVITGYGGDSSDYTENHMWNMVQLDNTWYNMDITWDDTEKNNISYMYFLKSDKDFPMHIRMGSYDTSYFNSIVSDKSYKLPFRLRMGMSIMKWGILIAFIIIEAVLLVIRQKKNKKMREIYEQKQTYY